MQLNEVYAVFTHFPLHDLKIQAVDIPTGHHSGHLHVAMVMVPVPCPQSQVTAMTSWDFTCPFFFSCLSQHLPSFSQNLPLYHPKHPASGPMNSCMSCQLLTVVFPSLEVGPVPGNTEAD